MATMNISLPDEMKAFVEGQVATGHFANASDFMRDIIRDQMWSTGRNGKPWTTESLSVALEAGMGSGVSNRSPREIFESVMSEKA
jgi:antitoxin ParD1/3/4